MYQLNIRTQSGKFYERHTHHSIKYLEELAEVYHRHGYITSIERY